MITIMTSANNGKRIQTNDKITTYPYGYFDIDSTHVNIDNHTDGFQKLIERAKTLRIRLDNRNNKRVQGKVK